MTAGTLTSVQLEAIKVGAQHALPVGVHHAEVHQVQDMMRGMMIETITAYVYGNRGQTATVRRSVTEARFPRWVPKWLRARWSRQMVLTVDATPFVVYPDMQYAVPKLGAPVRFLEHETDWKARVA